MYHAYLSSTMLFAVRFLTIGLPKHQRHYTITLKLEYVEPEVRSASTMTHKFSDAKRRTGRACTWLVHVQTNSLFSFQSPSPFLKKLTKFLSVRNPTETSMGPSAIAMYIEEAIESS